MVKPARPGDAPGYKCKANRDGTWREGWEARHDIVRRGYRPSWVRLFYPDTPDGRRQLEARCKDLQGRCSRGPRTKALFPNVAMMAQSAASRITSRPMRFSPYRQMKWNSQANFDKTVKIITASVGDHQIGKLLGPDFLRWHRNWGSPVGEGRPSRLWRAKHCMDTVRRMVAYGVTLGFSDCLRADIILGKMRFPTPPARRSPPEVSHASARPSEAAHKIGLGSIALATVLRFELSLSRRT